MGTTLATLRPLLSAHCWYMRLLSSSAAHTSGMGSKQYMMPLGPSTGAAIRAKEPTLAPQSKTTSPARTHTRYAQAQQ